MSTSLSLLFAAVTFTAYLCVCSGQDYVLLNNRILEHKGSGKCLTVTEEYQLFLDACNYDLDEPLVAGVFSVVRHNLGGHVMRWRTGPIPGAIEGCLQALKPNKAPVAADEEEEDEDDQHDTASKKSSGQLRLVACDTRDETLNWQFERSGNGSYQYLLKKYPNGPCVATTGADGAGVFTLPCNEDDVRQVWRVCQDVEKAKCDV